ncbi:MAG: DUF1566 domain-containing protein [Pseudomonadota bacterium]
MRKRDPANFLGGQNVQVFAPMALAAFLVAPSAHAGDLQVVDVSLPNGDFSGGLNEWTVQVSPQSQSPAGTVEVVNGAARIAKGAAFSSGLARSFAAPDGLVALRLRLATLPQFGSSGAFIPEAFDLQLTGDSGFSRVATFSPVGSSAVNATAVPSGLNFGQGISLNGDVLRIPIPDALAGEILSFTATLVGASSDTVATVTIDDLVLEVEQLITPPILNPGDCLVFSDGYDIRTDVGLTRLANCAIGQVGDTGVTGCAGGDGSCPAPGLPGQDAEAGRDALATQGLLAKVGQGPEGFDYTKLDETGVDLPDDAASWSCVRDNFTGLVWEVKVDDPANPSHYEHTYSWYEPDMSLDGGQSGVLDGGNCAVGSCDTAGLVTTLNDAAFCGSRGWRMPTREELLGLVHAGRNDPALATELFPLGQGNYWSRTPNSGDAASAWRLDFTDGRRETSAKLTPLRVRLVRESGR